MGFDSCLVRVVPYAAMLTMECISVGLGTLSKAAMIKGMSRYVYVFYANALAFLLILPVCLIFDRKKWAALNFSLLCKFFLVSLLISTINPNCSNAGIDYSSPTLGSAMRNLIPAFTFFLAVIFRCWAFFFVFFFHHKMEKLDIRSWTSQVKIMATLLTIFGALVLIFYKGSPIGSSRDEPSFSAIKSSQGVIYILQNLLSNGSNWVIGGFLLATSSLCISIWVIAQGAILKEYPSEKTIVTFYFLFASIQCAVVALVAEGKNVNAWRLRPDVELLPVIYSAVFASLGVYFVEIWCIRKKGPVFVAMFKPLGVAIAAAVNFIFLGERLPVGIIVGSIIVITGFYGVIWANSKENEDQDLAQEKMPLLQNDRDVTP